ncbi:mitochondrial E3 ubiquitin protein ligase 1-like [Euwallacea similis]|uniref:mitochondrial E3 ubiquitin protein ligase 1-like n=1 Tax=Euwallacea similis TaxID=1736056 RepID=UPI00344D1CD8
MDYIIELIALGIDSMVLITSLRQYCKKSSSLSMISSAPTITVDKKLKQSIKTQPDAKLPYIAIRGAVKSIGVPIISGNNPKVSGVIQCLKIKEHVVQRSSSGFWSDSERTIQEVHNVIPFGLESKGIVVEVVDPLIAEYLDMEVISDTFTPTVPSMMDHIWGFFSGFRQRGVQSTEKMLREGTLMTGIGELVYEQDGSFKLQSPSNGGLYYLTSLPVASLQKKLEASKRNYGILALVCTAIGAVIAGIVIRKYLKQQKLLKDEEERRSLREETRKRNRRSTRTKDQLSDTQLCVVCRSNPIEVILLPCGHVCLCEDCSDDISSLCPICRAVIEQKAPAYVV